MQPIYISLPIMSLGRSAVEKILLAHLCERAAQDAGQCTDSNTTLAEALGMHSKTISELISRLGEATLIAVTVDKEQANKRILRPLAEFLTDYPVLTDSTKPDYPSKPDSLSRLAKDYPSIADSTQPDYPSKPDSTQSDYERITHSPARRCPITDIDITHQGDNYPVVTAATIKRLYKTDRHQFEEVMTRLEISAPNDSSMSGRCMSMALKVGALVNTYPADHFKKLALSQFLNAQRPKRLCPVTDVDITHQRPSCRFVTILTLKNLIRTDRPAFDQLVNRFLTPAQFSESVSMKTHLLAERVRQVGNTQV
ncbi:hypothetical protein GO755_04570 [Spirosoma sp. HMF4905]|uniref:Helix-turn-helix domain-containing protein n=1 Tax=Spirosoma arboris TaxID=2682092 RepID=A0A7K1S6P3_9BACT|nr:helix-turn-helix domain-containing protein [Spirosoma arboris]MVM29296.1 hypothetical protein [Spirosoma arboris]